jgi:hypothetical protein
VPEFDACPVDEPLAALARHYPGAEADPASYFRVRARLERLLARSW